MSVSGHCCQKNVCRSTSAEMEMGGLQEDFEESEGLYTFKAAHRASYSVLASVFVAPSHSFLG